jgi:pimeloyl-ACP methyl ester carboxylesterase
VLRHLTAPDGVRLACDVAGAGPPLVMVHGAGSARWSFDLVRPHLESRFTVWALDRRGRGDSDDGDAYSLEREFEDVEAVVRDAEPGGLPDVFLFGHSYGALVAAGAAARVGRLRGLALYEPPMGGVLADEAWIARYEARVAAGARADAVRAFMHDVGGYSEEEIDAMEGTPVWDARLEIAPTAVRELRAERELELDSIGVRRLSPVPSVLLLGSESPNWARRSTEAFAAAIRGAEIRVLEGHGHGANMSGPELVAAELQRLLSTVIESGHDRDAAS